MDALIRAGRRLLSMRHRQTLAKRATRSLAELLEPRQHLTTTTIVLHPNGTTSMSGVTVSFDGSSLDPDDPNGAPGYDATNTDVGFTVSGLPAHTHVRLVDSGLDNESYPSGQGDSDTTKVKLGSKTLETTRTATEWVNDGDGDWAGWRSETTTTGDSATAWSAHTGSSLTGSVGSSDFEGSDFAWAFDVTIQIYTPSVSISGGGSVAEDGEPVTLTVSRDGDSSLWDDSLSVPITTGGDATLGADYTLSPQTATIPSGEGSVEVTFTPIWDGVAENDETATFTANPAAPALAVGGPAVVTLQNKIKNYTINVSQTAVQMNANDQSGQKSFTAQLLGDGVPISSPGIDIAIILGGTAGDSATTAGFRATTQDYLIEVKSGAAVISRSFQIQVTASVGGVKRAFKTIVVSVG